jgi:polysaccharide deacetylase
MDRRLTGIAIPCVLLVSTVLCLMFANSANLLLSKFSIAGDIFLAQAKKHTSKPTKQGGGSSSTSISSSNVKQSAAPYPKLQSSVSGTNGSSIFSGNKVVMIGFDDSHKSQFTYAKPILDKYGFKASFFEVCTWVGKTSDRQSWQDVAALQRDGMDIESHTMTHAHLPTLLSSPNQLTYEIGGSKQCLAQHGVNATIFGYPLNLGSDNPKIVGVVAKYYGLARSGSAPLMFLNCKGYTTQQNGCSTYSSNGKLTYANRYDVRSDSFRHISSNHNSSPSQQYQLFVQRMNSQIPYNGNGRINAIPIITYHNLTNSIQNYNRTPSTITVDLFAQQMKYLHDNGFKVLLLNRLGYDTTNNVFYIKNTPLSGPGTITSAATYDRAPTNSTNTNIK